MTAGAIRTGRDGPLGWLTIDRPHRLNAIGNAMWEAVPEAVRELDNDPAVRVIVLRGAGEEAFAAGADIAELDAMGRDAVALSDFERRFERAQQRLETTTKPVIAAIRGVCMGGGLALAVACDLRIAGEDARFAIPAARLGLGYAAPAVARLVRAAGPSGAFALLATGRPVDAREALRMRLVDEVVAPEAVFAQAENTARIMAANAPLTLAAAKAAVRAVSEGDGALEQAQAMIARCGASADFAEGRRAFVEKRAPRFEGR